VYVCVCARGEKERGVGSLTSDEKLYEIAEIGRDRRKDSGNFAVEPVCKCLYVLDTHNVMAVFIFTIIILLIFVATIHNWGGFTL